MAVGWDGWLVEWMDVTEYSWYYVDGTSSILVCTNTTLRILRLFFCWLGPFFYCTLLFCAVRPFLLCHNASLLSIMDST